MGHIPESEYITENEIIQALELSCLKYGIDFDKLADETQSRFNGLLMDIQPKLFPKINKLSILQNAAAVGQPFDYDYIIYIYNIFYKLCTVYNKDCNVNAFSNLLGLDINLWDGWRSDRFNRKMCEFSKKIEKNREQNLTDRLYSNKANPIGIMAILNHSYKWNDESPKIEQNQETRTTLEIAQEIGLPMFDDE